MNTYTPPTGNTSQGQQLNQGFNQLIASAGNTVNTGQTLTPEVAAAAEQGVASANQNIQSTMTPGARQGYLDATNIGAAQNNYDALAKQLAQYDTMVLQPQFAGQNPGTPSELSGISGYFNPNLSYNTADTQTPSQTLYNANPKYALSSQVDQGNSIVSLLGTLNKVLSNESARGTNKYTSDLKSAAATLSGLTDILRMNTDLTMKKAELAESAANRAASRGSKADSEFDSAIADGISLLQSGEDWGPVFNRIKAKYPDRSNEEIRTQLGPQWEKAGAYEKWIAKKTGAKGDKVGFQKDLESMVPKLDNLAKEWGRASIVDKINPGSPVGIELGNTKSILGQMVARLIENGRLSNQDREFYQSKLPQWWMNEQQAQAAVNGFKEAVKSNLVDPEDATLIDKTIEGNEWQ